MTMLMIFPRCRGFAVGRYCASGLRRFVFTRSLRLDAASKCGNFKRYEPSASVRVTNSLFGSGERSLNAYHAGLAAATLAMGLRKGRARLSPLVKGGFLPPAKYIDLQT